MSVYLRAKFQVSSITLMSFRLGVILPPTSKRTPKKPTQIRVKHQAHKMVKHTQSFRRQIADELSVFEHFVGLALKGLRELTKETPNSVIF